MKICKITCLALCILTLIIGSNRMAEAGQNHRHWVDHELAPFKQYILPLVQSISESPNLSREEWEIIHTTVLNEENFDQPIHIAHWAILLKMVLDPDQGKDNGQMLDMYVYKLGTGVHILREDAVGGLVKLLIAGYVKGSGSAEELEPSKALKDLLDISERQIVLVQMAYCESILDSGTKDMFRPKDYLTNAEAVSMLFKVIEKYHIKFNIELNLPQDHWSLPSINRYLENTRPLGEHLKVVENMVNLKNNNGD